MTHEQNREGDHVNDRSRSWEQMGAASGLFAALLFAVAFIIFLSTDPGGGNTRSSPTSPTRRPLPPSSPTT